MFQRSGLRSLHNRVRDKTIADVMSASLRAGEPLLSDPELCSLHALVDFHWVPVEYHGFDRHDGHPRWFRMLAEQYPGSVFLLNVRPLEDWVISKANGRQFVQFHIRIPTAGLSITEV